MAKEIPFLVVGGGIGGLATALNLANTLGRPITVLEQAAEFGEVGAGIQLAPNAMSILDRLGVLEAIKEKAVFPRRLVLLDAITGEEKSILHLNEKFQQRFGGYPYIVTHRPDLLEALLDACRENKLITLLTNKEVVSVESLDSYGRVTCTDGSVYEAEAVIGADGLRSKTRTLFTDETDQLVRSQYVAYRGTIPITESIPANMNDVVCYMGPSLHMVQYPVRRKELLNQVVVFKSFNFKEDSDDWGTPEELTERFSVCCPYVQNAVKFVNLQRRWEMMDREPIHNWTKGRVTLLGDAAHPMLQYLAQGACQALEDAIVIGDKLQLHNTDYEKAFMDYQEERIPRTHRVQRNARRFGQFLHVSDPSALLLRDYIFSQRDEENTQAIEWLYDYANIFSKNNLK